MTDVTVYPEDVTLFIDVTLPLLHERQKALEAIGEHSPKTQLAIEQGVELRGRILEGMLALRKDLSAHNSFPGIAS